MVFNITSISVEENIDLAELRLYTLVQRDRIMYIGVDRKVSVYEVMENDAGFHLIDSKHIYGRDSAWETFDVTSAVRRWVHKFNSIQILEIRIESVFHSVSMGDLDILTKNSNKNEPLLVVFSSDDRKRKLHENERHELVTHEMDMYDVQDDLSVDSPSNDNITDDTNSDVVLNRFKRRGRRHAVCRRKPMYVSFEEINWDSWIIAPRGYQAYECTGRCYFPLSDHLSPTKHAIIQSLVHASKPRKVSRVCCVPTKLDPISILYIDEQGIVTYKYKYEGMVVSECGCR
ncbi:hypothetical protein FSP39_001575 [Pinctada imbricata]|uniref:TGF-beta family profile domain-containing protein n=1 Tax=Pinctada imbricata TaxID=66713 RepID=A0AA89BPH0_PINIB|nr:hypothetical protein FSP39_001575 [Pinctada imbricata]